MSRTVIVLYKTRRRAIYCVGFVRSCMLMCGIMYVPWALAWGLGACQTGQETWKANQSPNRVSASLTGNANVLISGTSKGTLAESRRKRSKRSVR